MAGFIDRLCSFYHLAVKKRTIFDIKKALKEKNEDWNRFPQYVYSGYVGYTQESWKVETASDFSQKWEKYFN